jgi:hypothetical protein
VKTGHERGASADQGFRLPEQLGSFCQNKLLQDYILISYRIQALRAKKTVRAFIDQTDDRLISKFGRTPSSFEFTVVPALLNGCRRTQRSW